MPQVGGIYSSGGNASNISSTIDNGIIANEEDSVSRGSAICYNEINGDSTVSPANTTYDNGSSPQGISCYYSNYAQTLRAAVIQSALDPINSNTALTPQSTSYDNDAIMAMAATPVNTMPEIVGFGEEQPKRDYFMTVSNETLGTANVNTDSRCLPAAFTLNAAPNVYEITNHLNGNHERSLSTCAQNNSDDNWELYRSSTNNKKINTATSGLFMANNLPPRYVDNGQISVKYNTLFHMKPQSLYKNRTGRGHSSNTLNISSCCLRNAYNQPLGPFPPTLPVVAHNPAMGALSLHHSRAPSNYQLSPPPYTRPMLQLGVRSHPVNSNPQHEYITKPPYIVRVDYDRNGVRYLSSLNTTLKDPLFAAFSLRLLNNSKRHKVYQPSIPFQPAPNILTPSSYRLSSLPSTIYGSTHVISAPFPSYSVGYGKSCYASNWCTSQNKGAAITTSTEFMYPQHLIRPPFALRCVEGGSCAGLAQ